MTGPVESAREFAEKTFYLVHEMLLGDILDEPIIERVTKQIEARDAAIRAAAFADGRKAAFAEIDQARRTESFGTDEAAIAAKAKEPRDEARTDGGPQGRTKGEPTT